MIGTVLRIRYELTQLVSEGPIFNAYLARDRVEGREVCVRVLQSGLAPEKELTRRLFSVVMKYSGIRSPNLEALLEVDEDQGSTFLVSEFTRGITLAERIKKLAPFSVPVSIATLISMCDALSLLHATGLCHGDLRPENVMVLVDGQVRLQLAGVWESYSASAHSGALILPYMAPYLAPEISAGGMPTPTSDVYAAGIMLFELISGRLPYNGDTPVAMAIKHATAAVPSVRMYNPAVPMVLDEIIKKAMAKEPSDRYRSAAELLQDLRIMQDALRFGRSLTWPIQNTVVVAAPDEAPIAPRMSAIREKPEPAGKKPRRERERGDVPPWMFMLILLFGGFLAAMVFAWIYNFGHKAKEVRVPKIVGMKIVEAGNLLKDTGLTMKIIGPPLPGKIADMVVDQIPGSGEKVREGTTIIVHKSAGPESVSVPRIIGMTADAAKTFLERSDLKLDESYGKANHPGEAEDTILEQNPPEYSAVPKGTKVHVVVQSDNVPVQQPPAPGDENIQAKYRLKVRLTGIHETVDVRIAIVDARGSRDVLTQRGRPDENIDVTAIGFGKQVTFQVFYNGTKVYEQTQSAPPEVLATPTPTEAPAGTGETP